ncbi:MAG: glutathionylspermidine synthase family protein [Deltaproteobacteria bacterium]|nr:glutathionylspermidine synthase family protein [Deltaproteobacteria bacterium]
MRDFEAYAARIVASGFITDPWFEGAPRFDSTPAILSVEQHRALCAAGEDLTLVLDEALRLLLDDDDQRAAFLRLAPAQEAMLQASGALWHGLARADVFVTDDGSLQVTELNSDTPTGEPEAIVLGVLGQQDHPELDDACARLAPSLAALWTALHQTLVDDVAHKTAAIVYPTEFTEDLSLVRLYRQLLEESGFKVILGSPFNLHADDDGGLSLFGERVTLLLRHYKTDWWGERESVWLDDAITDHEALRGPLTAVLTAQSRRKVAVANPFGSVAVQNKRLMAFCWERIHRFSTRSQQAIERLIPYTARLEAVHEAQIRADKDNWVIKSDYGAEGDEVIIGRFTDAAAWEKTLQLARPGRFIAQRFFQAKQVDGVVENHGVFVVAGEACGVYTRRDKGHTDASALSVPTLIKHDRSTS